MFYRMIILLLFSITYIGKGQSTVVKHFTTEDGLSHDISYDIIQDDKGYIWIATDDGLSQFDGESFRNYNNTILASDYIISLKKHKNGLLLGTWGSGVLEFKDGYIQSVNTDKTSHLQINRLNTLSDSICVLRRVNENNFGLYNLNTKVYTPYTLVNTDKNNPKIQSASDQNNLSMIASTQVLVFEDTLWLMAGRSIHKNGNHLKGLYQLDHHLKLKPAYPALANMYINTFYKDKIGAWAINNNHTLIQLENQSIKKQFSIPKDIGEIIEILPFKNKVFMISDSYILYEFNVEDHSFTNLSEAYDIPTFVSNILIDKDQHLWLTTYGDGIYRIELKKHKFIDHTILPNANVSDIEFTNQVILTISKGHLTKFNKDFSYIKDYPLSSYIEQFSPYSSSNKEVNITDYYNTSQSFKDSSVALVRKRNWEIAHTNKLIYITQDSIYFHHPTTKHVLKKYNHIAYINDAKTDENHLYISYVGKGIFKYNFKGDLIQIYNPSHGLYTHKINDFILDHDTLWLATNAGLVKAYDSTYNHFNVSNGLLANGINAVYKDKHNVLWLGTQKGLCLLQNNTFYSIGQCSGQKSSYITRIKSHQDKLYVCGNKGIYIYDNKKAFKPHSNTTLNITQLDQPYWFILDKTNFVNHKSIQTAYSINNKPWKSFTQNELSFEHLEEGEYNIRFKYRDHTSNWMFSKPYAFSIHIPWYTRPWFYASITGAISLVIIILIYRQLKHVEKKNIIFQNTLTEREILKKELKNIRANIARDFHDDLGNKLASISILSKMEYDKRKQGHKEPLDNILQIQQEADALYGGMRDFIWTLDDANNNLQELQTYLTDFGEQLFEHSNITFISTHALPDMDIPLPYYWNKQLILIFKEGMTNSLKHSKADTVTLNVDLNNNILKIKLQDNGSGFNYNQLKRVNGLNNMKSRMKSLDAQLEITSTNGVSICFTGSIKSQS